MRKIICVILALFLASSAAFAGYQIFREYTERQESADTYTDLENLISFPEVLPEEEPDETNLSESGETEPAPVGPTIDFAGLEEINEDCVAWIYIEDTAINYPVVQGSDNSYYLKHLIDGKWNSVGCIFLDSRVDSDISDRHSNAIGHSWQQSVEGLLCEKVRHPGEEHPCIHAQIWSKADGASQHSAYLRNPWALSSRYNCFFCACDRCYVFLHEMAASVVGALERLQN